MTPALAFDVQDPPTDLPGIPSRIGRFLIREEIGRGSNGVVYSATDPVLGRDVAIKAIPLDAGNPAQRDVEASFLQEAKMAAGLNHPSIVTVFDAGKTETIAYIAMERLTGSDLHHWLGTNRSMSAENAAALIARVSDAVHFAHRRGLIHRDIKPSNIFLSRDLKPKVLDFGIALAQGKQASADEPRKLIGTPNYMSPEQALGRALDARSDIFSIGTILYELISGERAFDGSSVDEILTKVVKVEPPPLHHWRPDVAPQMEEIVARALAKNPANRYQTAAQLRHDLAAFAGRPVGPGTNPAADLPALPARSRQRPGPGALLATGAAIVGLSLTFAFWYWGQRDGADAGAGPGAMAGAAGGGVPAGAAAPVHETAGAAGAGARRPAPAAPGPEAAARRPRPTARRQTVRPPPIGAMSPSRRRHRCRSSPAPSRWRSSPGARSTSTATTSAFRRR